MVCREQLGGADPSLHQLEPYEPKLQWRSELGVAQLGLRVFLLADGLALTPTPADWELLAQVRMRPPRLLRHQLAAGTCSPRARRASPGTCEARAASQSGMHGGWSAA